MMRLIGAALLTGGSALLGICAVRHLNSRVDHLRQLITGLEVVIREMDHCLAPLPELLAQAAKQTDRNVSVFFDLCAQGAEHLNGRSFQTVWNQAIEAGQLRLEHADLSLLEQLGGILGRYDGESQRKALQTTVDRLEEQRAEAASQSSRLGRVYSVLSLTAGAFLLILLI